MEKINVLIVDDSALMRNLISKMVDSADDLQVVGTAMNGAFALKKMPSLEPDVIVLDLEMPIMSGIDFLKVRKEQNIDIPVIILSSLARKGAQVTMEALALGAQDFIMKPSGSISQDIHVVQEQLIGLLKAYGNKYKKNKKDEKPAVFLPEDFQKKAEEIHRLVKQQAPKITLTPAKPLKPLGSFDLIAIGISTGGPNALRKLFSQFPKDINLPIVVVQHMPAGFTAEFAKSLDKLTSLEVKEAEDGDLILPGRVLIAPGDRHLLLERRKLAVIARLSDETQVNGHKPSVGVLFHSVAESYGYNILAIIMTGMGKDGSWEIGQIYKQGGHTMAQDEQSSVVFGMPKVAIENGFIHNIVSLDKIPQTIHELNQRYNG